MKKKHLIISILTFFSFFLPFNTVSAQQKTNLLDITVNPSAIEITNDPGTNFQGKFRIRNNANISINFALSVSKLLPNGSYDMVSPTDASAQDEFIHWISFGQATISAKPKEWTTIAYSIAIPKTAAFGYYYGIKISQATNQQQVPGSKIQGEVLIPLLLTVRKNGAVAKATVISFKPTFFLNEYLPVLFTVRVSNSGNVQVKPRGNIFVHTGNDNNMATLDINASQGNILPGGNRAFTASWNDGFFVKEPIMKDGEIELDKNNKPMTHLVINWNNLTHFRIGKYTANLLLVYDNGKRDVPIEAATTFWVFPYTIVGVSIISILIIVLIIRLLIKLAIKRELKKYKRT